MTSSIAKSVFDDTSRRTYLNLELHESTHPAGSEPAGRGFVGGYTRRVTPVPIPNTVVKPAGPMILLQRESRSLPAFIKSPGPSPDRGFLAFLLVGTEGQARLRPSRVVRSRCGWREPRPPLTPPRETAVGPEGWL